MKYINQVIHGDCLEKLKLLDDNSVHSIVCDPPYHLTSITKRFGKKTSAPAKYGKDGSFKRLSKGFMGKEWDGVDETGIGIAQKVELWKECLRVLKPGGHLLAFSGTRTYHRMTVAIEDAGFEIRDMINWVYGSGFPKSHNIGKQIDKLQGNKRKVVKKGIVPDITGDAYGTMNEKQNGSYKQKEFNYTKGNSEWEGWGTALKPSQEPIVMARKPLSESTVAKNVLKWGVGGINIDECRIGTEIRNNGTSLPDIRGKSFSSEITSQRKRLERPESIVEGRWPANSIFECICDETKEIKSDKNPFKYKDNNTGIIHTNPNCPCYILDKQSGNTKSTKRSSKNNKKTEYTNTYTPKNSLYTDTNSYADVGGASRFFYCPKVSKKERNMGCDGLDEKQMNVTENNARTWNDRCKICKKKFVGSENTICKCKLKITDKTIYTQKNNHPTVKPLALLRYLIKLVTPKSGIVLDPFAGSGSTLISAKQNGYNYIGIELTDEYIPIIDARLKSVKLPKKNKFFKEK